MRAGQKTLDLALNKNGSTDDAASLELAMRRGLPLANLDRALQHSALACGVRLLP